MNQPLYRVCEKCGSEAYLETVERSPGDYATYYKCPKCDTGPKAFAKGCLGQIILLTVIGLGMSLLGFLFQPTGVLEVLAGLLGLVIVGFIIKVIW